MSYTLPSAFGLLRALAGILSSLTHLNNFPLVLTLSQANILTGSRFQYCVDRKNEDPLDELVDLGFV